MCLQSTHQPGHDLAGDVVGADGERAEGPGLSWLKVHLRVAAHERHRHASPELDRRPKHRHVLEADSHRGPFRLKHPEAGADPEVASDASGELGLVHVTRAGTGVLTTVSNRIT